MKEGKIIIESHKLDAVSIPLDKYYKDGWEVKSFTTIIENHKVDSTYGSSSVVAPYIIVSILLERDIVNQDTDDVSRG